MNEFSMFLNGVFLFFVLFQILFAVYGQRCLMIDIVDRYFYLIFSFIRAFIFIVKCCCCYSVGFLNSFFLFFVSNQLNGQFFLILTNIFSFQHKFLISFFSVCWWSTNTLLQPWIDDEDNHKDSGQTHIHDNSLFYQNQPFNPLITNSIG